MASTKGLYPILVANAVINALSSPASVVLNIITVQALRKTPSIPKNLKTLLLSLAVSDLGVGLLVQPMYVARLVMEIKQHSDNIVYHGVDIALSSQYIVLCFVYWYRRFNCWQILGDSSSSQIPGTCDSQAGCCCSELSLGFKCLNCLACFEMDTGSRLYLRNH